MTRPLPFPPTEENEDRGGGSSGALERLLTRAVMSSPGVKQVHINLVTDGE